MISRHLADEIRSCITGRGWYDNDAAEVEHDYGGDSDDGAFAEDIYIVKDGGETKRFQVTVKELQ